MCKWVKSRFIQLPGIQRVVAPVPGEQARQCIRPYRVHHFLNYGLVVRFRLLPTPPLGDAVSFSYGQPVFCPMGTSTPLLVRTLRRTSIRVPRVFSLPRQCLRAKKGIHARRVCYYGDGTTQASYPYPLCLWPVRELPPQSSSNAQLLQ